MVICHSKSYDFYIKAKIVFIWEVYKVDKELVNEKYEEKIKRNKKRKKKNFILLVIGLIVLFGVSFFVGAKLSASRSMPTSTAKVETPKNSKLEKKDSYSNNPNYMKNTQQFNPYKKDGIKVAYLTFDDGPSLNVTPKILDTLKKENIKATFFVIGQMAAENPAIIKREASEEHKVANHTYSHDYKYIYKNPKNLLADFSKCNTTLKGILGDKYNNNLVRFPGGAFSKKLESYKQATKEAGYNYIDWNDLTGDAEGRHVAVIKLMSNIKMNTGDQEDIVVLMHDAPEKDTTIDALPKVIEYLKSKGYTFQTLQ